MSDSGILENPFGVTPDLRYLYESRTHAEARSSLIAGIECGVGFQALIAPPGMGKTTILLSVLELFKDVARTAFLSQTQGDSRDFLRYLLLDLDCDTHDSDLVRMQDAINQLLIREHCAGRHTIIVIDEAQGLDFPVLETVRLLSNFETTSEKLLKIILAGTPQFAERLSNPRLAQLSQRLSILSTLVPFDLQDTINYIDHRLGVAGYQGPALFTLEALKLVWERSRGVPRDINTLCFNALLLARAVEQKQIDSDILHEVVADIDLDRFCFNTDTPASGSQDGQAPNRLALGNAAADRGVHQRRCSKVETPRHRQSPSEVMAALRRKLATDNLDFDAFLAQIVEWAQALTAASGAAVALRHQHVFLCRAGCGETGPPLGAELGTDSGISGECLRTSTALCCEDTESDSRVDAVVCRQLGLRAIAVVPIRGRTRVAGILEVFSTEPHAFDCRHSDILQGLAELVTTARGRVIQENQTTTSEPAMAMQTEPKQGIPAASVDSGKPNQCKHLERLSPTNRCWMAVRETGAFQGSIAEEDCDGSMPKLPQHDPFCPGRLTGWLQVLGRRAIPEPILVGVTLTLLVALVYVVVK